MPLSPDPRATGARTASWNPPDLTPGVVATAPSPDATPVTPFDVSPAFGIPEAVLAPARAAAANEGYVAGWNRGHRDGLAQAAADSEVARARAEQEQALALVALERAAESVRTAAQALAAREVAAAADIEELIVASAFAVAEALVGATLADDHGRARAVVARALSLVPADQPVTVTVSRADFTVVGDLLHQRSHVSVAVDPTLAPGDAYASYDAGTIDARISVALDRVRTALATQQTAPELVAPRAAA